MQGVSVQQLAEKMKFKCFTPCVDMSKRMITTPEIKPNRHWSWQDILNILQKNESRSLEW